ncbi:MAG: hypothetical protein KDE52_03530 [Calditrichaeota bacterium]|nr:hypothetical protein [Calditrichota bacterium]MCB0267691.1 hypothetical protein [Calditrichota bacterium]MCB0288145.1 hypothetical protein [Calditrichota bacterium]MCB0299099.1 hypothetical protein [Calditrichota bacterium]MCB9067770.1 hypothetical protein [Calditrichia bacterium]
MNKHSKKILDELCNYLGYDLEGCMCKELHSAVEKDEDLQEYIDSVKKTVSICKEVYKEECLPEDVKANLLDKIKTKKRPTQCDD